MVHTSGDSRDYNSTPIAAKHQAAAITSTVQEPLLVLDKNLKVISASISFCTSFNLENASIEGKSFFDLGNRDWDIPQLKELLNAVLQENTRIENFVLTHNFPQLGLRSLLINANEFKLGNIEETHLLLSLKDTTYLDAGQQQEALYFNRFGDILTNSPAMICILKGPNHIFEIANEMYHQLIGRDNIIGKTVKEVLPEIEGQGFLQMLDKVYSSGEPFIGNEIPIKLDAGEGTLKNSYLDFVYQPILDSKGEVEGIFVHVVDVTEKVESRKKVEENESLLKEMIDTVPAIIWITDKDGRSTYLNENWYEYTGQSTKDAEGFGWLNAVHPEDRLSAEEQFKKANDNQTALSINYRLRTSEGDYRWVMDRGQPKFLSDGTYEGIVGTVVDVHEEKIQEQLIREKEHRIRSIVEEATVATAVYTGKDLNIELANDAMIKLWGKDPSVIGKNLEDALPELEGQPFIGLLQEVYSTGETYWGKEDKVDLMIGNKLQTGYFNFTYKPLRDEKGNIYGILNMAIDVTEMVKSKNLLKESESYFRQMADLMPDKVTNTDPEGNFIYFNQNWLHYTGFTSEELYTNFWTHLVHPDDLEEMRKNWKESLETGNDFETEVRYINRYGKYKWHLSRAEAVKDEHGKIKMWIGTNTEIHKLKEEEKRKEDFLKMVSHELKTPVTSIKGYVQLLLTLLNSDEEISTFKLPLRPSLERIDHQISRLTRLISEMLDLSRLEENKLELQKEKFSINDLVTETVQDINYTNTQHRISIEHDFKCEVFADRDRIGQVLINFITNAIKYSPDSRDIGIKISKSKNNQVSVSVRDQGIGIDKKNHKNIFKRFYRIGGKSEETYSGFGIGLYLANEIIERHEGAISVKSKKGKGSDFCFTLSVAKE
ncbi:PAS domain S-box protein [Salinimicrobium sp. GXAS 041]|uniref:PAS domain S-box protein n=1 Tax=Salinimicrobium sp. GXAS 041 TaxID=3400806 RepID=UPI003C7719CE